MSAAEATPRVVKLLAPATLVLMPVVPFHVPLPRADCTIPVTPVYAAPSQLPVAPPPPTALLLVGSRNAPAPIDSDRTLLTLLAPALGAIASVPAFTARAFTRTWFTVS